MDAVAEVATEDWRWSHLRFCHARREMLAALVQMMQDGMAPLDVQQEMDGTVTLMSSLWRLRNP